MFDDKHCSPYNKGNISCIPKKGLIKIASILNNNHNCLINLKSSKKKIYMDIINEIDNLSNCDKEACWLKIDEIKNFLSEREYNRLKDNFRPFMPEDWNTEPNKWLNTVNINNVLDQYALQYPKFKYMGASPIDYHLKSDSGECTVNELCNLRLNEMYKNKYESIGIVFNTDPHNKPGQHWFSIFIDLKGKNRHKKPTIYHFDSAAGEPSIEILNLVNDVKSQYKKLKRKEIDFLFNDKKHQSENTECGVYCLHFLVYMLQGKQFNKYINTKKTDKKMHKFREKFYIKCNN